MKSPNFLLIMADQLAPHFTATYGHEVVKTPAIDKLAERGCRFDSAYTPAPLCAPARYSMLSGKLPIKLKAYDNAAEFSSTVPTFAHYLRLLGYHTCLAGKMHFIGPDQLHGFNERLTTDVYPADYAWTPVWSKTGERIDKWYHNMNSVREAGIAATTFQLEYDDEVAFHTRRRLFDFARDSDSPPFLMTAAFIHPHDPFVARKEWWDLYQSDEIDQPVLALGDCPVDSHSQRLISDCQIDRHPPSAEQIRNARHAYYANTSYFDNWIGQFVAVLEETGLAENTIVIVTSDHGEMLGERGLWYKMNFFENSVRVPLVVAGPGIVHSTIETSCSLVDLMPTLLDLALQNGTPDAHLRAPIDGKSLRPQLEGSKEETPVTISEYCAESTSYPMFMLRKDSYKYIHCDSDPVQLYNLDEDPLEINNLADNPEYSDVAADFAKIVDDRWDKEAIRNDVFAYQDARLLVHEAMQRGARTSWEYQPMVDAANQYVRNHLDWTVQAARSRFPRV